MLKSAFRGFVNRTPALCYHHLHSKGLRMVAMMNGDLFPDSKATMLTFTVLTAFAIAISYADRSNLSTAIIPMAYQYHWSTFFSGIVLSAFWAGYASTQIVGGQIADRIGGERLLVLALLVWSVCTGLTPLLTDVGLHVNFKSIPLSSALVVTDRVVLGIGEGLALPAIHSMIPKYVAPQFRSTSASIVTAACYVGALLSNLISPILIIQFDWKASFYLFALLPPIVWLPLWCAFQRRQNGSPIAPVVAQTNDLNNHFEIGSPTAVESSRNVSSTSTYKASVWELLRQPPVWAIIAAQYGQSWGMIGLLSWLPSYYSDKFGVPLVDLGYITAVPYLAQTVVSAAAGYVADYAINVRKLRILYVRNALQTVGMVAPALCLAYCAYGAQLSSTITGIQNEGLSPQLAVGLITVGSALSALTSAAVSCNQFDLSPQNSGSIFGIANTASCMAALIAVPLSGALYDRTHSWDVVFALFAAHYLLGACCWLLWASDKPLVFYSDKKVL